MIPNMTLYLTMNTRIISKKANNFPKFADHFLDGTARNWHITLTFEYMRAKIRFQKKQIPCEFVKVRVKIWSLKGIFGGGGG